ncbi:hypothetical protein [Micromonospora auratinigra]|uniref:Uncharacterized protein n=1 Tax=Micromonospora auratinigra TaxID=261654 RepID=A0A1A9A995_9ACTN|nr:hypothetical protein [Micromonospora auratinigra]SBT53051.1 hypothetical protein GA0070611_5928 [Micromonospora auratinigra]
MTESFVDSALGPALRQATRAVDVPEDPWPGFTRRERRHRRTRLARRAVLAGVVAALVGVQSNVLPLPGWAPGIAVAAAPAALLDGPPRGTLADDRAWLAALRARVGGDPRLRDGDLWGAGPAAGAWRVGDPDRIRLLYGSDRPGHRVALVAVPLRFGLLTRETLVWYVGPAGAGAAQMDYAGHTRLDDSPVVTLLRAEPGRGGFAVVVGPPGSTVTISGDPRYTARGTLEYENLARADDGGIGVAVLPALPRQESVARVSRDGHLLYQGGLAGGPYLTPEPAGPEMDALLGPARRPVGGRPLDEVTLRTFVQSALTDSRLPAAGTTVRVRWSGRQHGLPAALLTVQPTGGGVIAYALHGDERSGHWTDLRLLLPAQGVDERPVGWRIRADTGARTPTDQVRVVAPPDAARVTVTVGDLPPAEVALDASSAGAVRVPPDRPAILTAYGADGRVLGATPVPPVETNMAGLPGDSPATRLTP